MALKVFISYQRDSEMVARQLYEKLSAMGFEVWQDVHNIRHTARWSVEINQALNDSQRLILLLTPSSMDSDEVFNEWFFFYNQRKPIHCLMVETCTPHYQLVPFQYLLWMDESKRNWERLKMELEADFNWPSVALRERVVSSPHAPQRTLPQAMQALLEAVRERDGVVALSESQLQEIARHRPADRQAYHLGRVAEWSQPRYQLDNRFVRLTLLLDQGEEAQGMRYQAVEQRRYEDLREVLQERSEPALVVLGAPGSGKSTLLRRLQLDHSLDRLRDEQEMLSFFVPLSRYRAAEGQPLPEPRQWLAQLWRLEYSQLPPLELLLEEGRVLLLLDALNEMPHRDTKDYQARVASWRAFLEAELGSGRGNRAVFSCRSLDYSTPLSSPELRVPQVVVQPMNDELVYEFIEAYAPAEADSIRQKLQGSPQFDLFRTPYFLKLLLEIVERSGSVPQGRAELFTGFVRRALQREVERGHRLFEADSLLKESDLLRLSQGKWASATELPRRGLLIPALSRLAYEMQAQRQQSDGAQIRLDYDEACELIAHERSEDILKAGVALNVLDVDSLSEEILYFHQLLQEYFAARQMAQTKTVARVAVAWRSDEVRPGLEETLQGLADSDPLPALPQTGWEETTLMSAAMLDDADGWIEEIAQVNLVLAGRCAANAEVKVSERLKGVLRQRLVGRSQDMGADLRARIAAGLALGELGDPRFERKTGPYGEYLLPPMGRIAAGDYLVGDDAGEYADEKPARRVKLAGFELGCFPVTNAEYGLFMAAGGYEEERWWESEEGQAWRRGEGSSEGSKQQVRDLVQQMRSMSEAGLRQALRGQVTAEQIEEFLELRSMSEADLETLLDEQYPSGQVIRQPRYWEDSAFNAAAQPVVGVNWYEASAYCAWLSAQTGQSYRLPTEGQWEAAARGTEGRRYAYGETLDIWRSNSFETHIRRTTPIGIFDNATPEGLYDLSGNVWEWTLSLFQPYPYAEDDGRNSKKDSNSARRALRGGAFYNSLNGLRAADRGYNDPVYADYVIGFRCALFSP